MAVDEAIYHEEGCSEVSSRGDSCVGGSLESTAEKIQQWIERPPHHIEEIIALEGGNEYKGRWGSSRRGNLV